MNLSYESSKGIIYVMAMCFTNVLQQSLVIKVKSVSVCTNVVHAGRTFLICEPSRLVTIYLFERNWLKKKSYPKIWLALVAMCLSDSPWSIALISPVWVCVCVRCIIFTRWRNMPKYAKNPILGSRPNMFSSHDNWCSDSLLRVCTLRCLTQFSTFGWI